MGQEFESSWVKKVVFTRHQHERTWKNMTEFCFASRIMSWSCHRTFLYVISDFFMLLQFLNVMLCLEQATRSMNERLEIMEMKLKMMRETRRGGWKDVTSWQEDPGYTSSPCCHNLFFQRCKIQFWDNILKSFNWEYLSYLWNPEEILTTSRQKLMMIVIFSYPY